MSSFSDSIKVPKVEFLSYKDEEMLADIQRLVSADLSEPYSVYLYRFFIHNWPNLCICGYLVDEATSKRGEMIACIVCKAEREASGVGLQGYIAMLAVNKAHRKRGLGIELVSRGIEEMKKMGCKEVYLETEESNKGALALYEKLGFSREERFLKYYLNGSNAYRLKLWIDANSEDGLDKGKSLSAEMEGLKVVA